MFDWLKLKLISSLRQNDSDQPINSGAHGCTVIWATEHLGDTPTGLTRSPVSAICWPWPA